MNYETIKALPKVELHCHLDGSIPLSSMEEILERKIDKKEVVAPLDGKDLKEYLEKFELPLQCMQTAEHLQKVSADFIADVAKENIQYVEVRFAPMLSVNEGLSVDQVIEAVLAGLEKGKQRFGVSYQVIVCTMRHHSSEDNIKMLSRAVKFLGKGICAADLAGNEKAYPMDEFQQVFEVAKKLGMPYTIHAGECGEVKNIANAIAYGATRIGHGIAMSGHKEVMELCAKNKIGVEMCPTSNLQTKALQGTSIYPVKEFLDAGIPVSIHTDNRTVSDTTVTEELMWVKEHCGLTDQEITQLLQNAICVSYASEPLKEALTAMLMEALRREEN